MTKQRIGGFSFENCRFLQIRARFGTFLLSAARLQLTGRGKSSKHENGRKKPCPEMIQTHLKPLPRFIRANFSTNKVILEAKIENFFSKLLQLTRFSRPPVSKIFDPPRLQKTKALSSMFNKIIFARLPIPSSLFCVFSKLPDETWTTFDDS